MSYASDLLQGCTIAPEGRRLFVLTLVLALTGVVLVSAAPLFLKFVIDLLNTGGSTSQAAGLLALMLATYAAGVIIYELKWLFFAQSDCCNYKAHLGKLLVTHPQESAMRLHRAAQSNGKYLAILFLTILPISFEVLTVAGSVAFIANAPLALSVLIGCSAQLLMVLSRTRTLNPLLTANREREFEYFQHLEHIGSRSNIGQRIEAWYDASLQISRVRYKMRAFSTLPVILAMSFANAMALFHWQDAVSVGAIAAMNTYFMQLAAKIEMLGNSLREALSARNQMYMPTRSAVAPSRG